MSQKKILLVEQFVDAELPANEQNNPPRQYYANLGCTLFRKNNKWWSRCPERAQEESTDDLNEYLGKYEKGDYLTRKTAIFDSYLGKLRMKWSGVINATALDYIFAKTETADVFYNTRKGVKVTFFRDDAGKVDEVKVEFEEVDLGQIWGRVNNLPKVSDNAGGTGGGDGGGGRTTGRDYNFSAWWGCLETVRKKLNRFQLIPSVDEKYVYESLTKLVDGAATQLRYYKEDNVVLWVKADGTDTVILKGSWECVSDDQYKIKWSDGQKSYIGLAESPIEDDDNQNNTEESSQDNQLGTPCSSYKKNCPTKQQILDGDGVLKKCFKCGLVREIQEIPIIKLLLEEIDPNYVTDELFGPKMELAIKKFQSKEGLSDDGIIGKDTMEALENSRSEDQKGTEVKPNTDPPKPTPTPKTTNPPKTTKPTPVANPDDDF